MTIEQEIIDKYERSDEESAIHLLIALALFLALVIFIGNLFNLDFIFSVTILIFPFAFVWRV